MGQLIDGIWKVDEIRPNKVDGTYKRENSVFRDWISEEEGAEFLPESGRYHLYISHACPWAHRTLIFRVLKNLEDHISVDVVDLDCDFYAFSAHKVYGPTGVGVLYAKKKWLEKLPPYIGGGAMISEVTKDKIKYASLPEKYEAGTMPTAEVVSFNESIKFMQSIGIKNITKHENELTNYALENMKKINSVNIVGTPKNKAGVISFTIEGIHPHDISTIVDEEGVAIRAGHHCCQILHERLNLSATARASFGIYNTKEDIDILCKAIENCRKIFELK